MVMPDAKVPSTISVSISSLANLAIEWWRLSSAMPPTSSAPARHAVRKIEDFLRECELEVHDMDGKPFDAGLAVRVIDAIDDPAIPSGKTIIGQTLSPMVLWRGQVIKSADVITRRGVSR
jgi:hypothetical protein